MVIVVLIAALAVLALSGPGPEPANAGADAGTTRPRSAGNLDRRVQRLLDVTLRSHGRRVRPAPGSFCLSTGDEAICVDRPPGAPPGRLPVHSGGTVEVRTEARASSGRIRVCNPRRCLPPRRGHRGGPRRWRVPLGRLTPDVDLVILAIAYPEGIVYFDAGLRTHWHRTATRPIQRGQQRSSSE